MCPPFCRCVDCVDTDGRTDWYYPLYSNFPSSRSFWVSQALGLFPSSAAILPTSESAPLPSRKAWLDTMYMARWHRLSMTLVRRMLDKNPSALERTTETIMTWSSFPGCIPRVSYMSDSWTCVHARDVRQIGPWNESTLKHLSSQLRSSSFNACSSSLRWASYGVTIRYETFSS